MTQSVELLLDPASEGMVLGEWARLAEAGLPTEQRVVPSPSHRPHVTLWAGPSVSAEVDAALPSTVAALDLPLLLGSVLVFGPRRGHVVLVRQVVASAGTTTAAHPRPSRTGCDLCGWLRGVRLRPRREPVGQRRPVLKPAAEWLPVAAAAPPEVLVE